MENANFLMIIINTWHETATGDLILTINAKEFSVSYKVQKKIEYFQTGLGTSGLIWLKTTTKIP